MSPHTSLFEQVEHSQPSVFTKAESRLQAAGEAAAEKSRLVGLSVIQLVPELFGSLFMEPLHLAPIAETMQLAWDGPTYATMHAPPQHGKSCVAEAFVVATLLRYPHLRIAYISHTSNLAETKSSSIRSKARAAGVRIKSDTDAKGQWETVEGGGLIAMGIGGPLTGNAVDILLVDDPYKDRKQAESPAYRQMVTDWYADVATTRIQPQGSVFVWHTRWTSHDLIGTIQKDKYQKTKFKSIVLPAMTGSVEAGNAVALWPERYPVSVLEHKRKTAGPLTWASLYQGRPRPRGGTLFGQVTTCKTKDIPTIGKMVGGIDLSYSQKTSSDESVIVTVRRSPTPRKLDLPVYWVVDVKHGAVKMSVFKSWMRRVKKRFKGIWFWFHGSSTERGSADQMCESGLPVEFVLASQVGDKYTRAQPAAAAWNDGRVIVPDDAEWFGEFTQQVCEFTGADGAPDDMVDGLSSAVIGAEDTPTMPSSFQDVDIGITI